MGVEHALQAIATGVDSYKDNSSRMADKNMDRAYRVCVW